MAHQPQAPDGERWLWDRPRLGQNQVEIERYALLQRRYGPHRRATRRQRVTAVAILVLWAAILVAYTVRWNPSFDDGCGVSPRFDCVVSVPVSR